MKKDDWVQAALTNDAMVSELLLRLKHSSDSDSDSLRFPPPPATAITTILPPRWGHRKNRSKPTAPSTTVTNGFGKEHRASPTTHLSWSGGGGSTSDGYDESSRPSDLSSGSRSVKANEGTSTSSCNKSDKRKSFVELKDEEGSLLKDSIHMNKELASMRMALNQQGSSESLKRIKTDLDQKPRNKMGKTVVEHERELKAAASLVNQSAKISCRVEAETESSQRGFVLPDLNMTPCEEDVVTMS